MSSLKFGHKFYTLLLFFFVRKCQLARKGQSDSVIRTYC